MSQSPSSTFKPPAMATLSSNFNVIFEKSLKAYKTKTNQDLTAHPLVTQLQACDSPAAILTILQDQVHQFEQSRTGDERLRRWLNPTINVLYAFSATLGQGIGLVFSPANVIFAGAGVLLLAAKDVEASQDLLIDVFERIENFFRRLEIYTDVPPTPAMTDMMVKIMVEVLDILATATKEMKQSRFKMFLRKVAGITKLDDGLKKLDKMTNEEARMANAEVLRLAHNIDENVKGVGTQVKDVDEKVQGVNKDVQVVGVQVQGVDENVKIVKERVQVVIDDTKEAAMEAKMVMQHIAYNVEDTNRRQLRENLRKWQSPSDPSTNHNIACNLQHGGTAEWFFDAEIFEEWKENGSLLWIHGKPGSGKSILCSAIIQKTAALYEAGTASMAYFYFDFRDVDKRSRRNLLPSLLIQLSARSDPFCDILSRLYKAHDDGVRQPSDGALIRCLKDMLILPDQGPVYLILDALDECPKTSGLPSFREQVLDLVKDLVDLCLPNLRICVTSRPEVDIKDALETVASHSVSLHDESGQQKDIAEYVQSVVHSNSIREIKRWRDADKELVIETLSERADGMFRWVFCQLETLRHCLPQNIPRALRELPASLDETYERVLKEIVLANRQQAYRLLQCLTVATRPLRVEELAEILALDFDGAKEGIPELKKDWRWKDQQEAVLSTCSSLIAVVDDGFRRVVQFSHFSVKEFLTSDRLATSSTEVSHFHIPLEPAHTVIVRACLGILLQMDGGVVHAEAKSSSPLAKYAAKHWVEHAQFGKVSRSVEDGMRRLFDLARPHFAAWLSVHDIDTYWDNFVGVTRHQSYQTDAPRGSPLYYASLCGFRDLAVQLIDENPQHLNARVGRNRSPLVAALHNKHFHTAELLHQRGANLGSRGEFNRTLLHAASVDGFVEVAQWLLARGADANSRDEKRNTPLHLAAQNGRIDFVRMLLRHRMIVDAKNLENRTPLHLASEDVHADVVRLLLQHKADLAARDLGHRTPLHLASSWKVRYTGHDDEEKPNANVRTVKVLLQHGANVTAQDDDHSTPLHMASSKGCSEITRLLIKHGADVNAPDGDHKMPLHLALGRKDGYSYSYESSEPLSGERAETAQILIKHSADVTARDNTHSTPLHLASSKGSPDIVRLLIKCGADVNALDGNREMPLHLALGWNRDQTQDSSARGRHASVATWSDSGGSLPYGVVYREPYREPYREEPAVAVDTETVQVLLENGADVTAQDDSDTLPLHLASSIGSLELVRLLVEYGADVTAQDHNHSTPLHVASSEGRHEIVQLFIKHGADVNALDDNHSTPLHLASLISTYSQNHHVESSAKAKTIRILLDHGADLTSLDNSHSTPLHIASSDGSPEIVRLLIKHGAYVNAVDGNRKTPLHLASSIDSNHELNASVKAEIVWILLGHGADVAARDDTHSTPLHLALSTGTPQIVRLLIKHGADVNALNGNRQKPLHLALTCLSYRLSTRYQSSEIVDSNNAPYHGEEPADIIQLLLEHGADVTARDDAHSTPLHLASSKGFPEIVRLLIKHGVDVNALDGNRKMPLHLALGWISKRTPRSSSWRGRGYRHVVDSDGSDSEDSLYHGEKPNVNIETVRILLEHGADVTAGGDTHTTPLHLVSSVGFPEMVRLLIEHGADINAQDRKHSTPLHLASSKLLPEIARLLIKNGADVNALNRNSKMPLHLALAAKDKHSGSMYRDEEKPNAKVNTVWMLLEHGADVTARDDTQTTPLHLASSMLSPEIVQLLIKYGADVNALDRDHKMPLYWALTTKDSGDYRRRSPLTKTVWILLDHGADVTTGDSTHSTPLHLASSKGSFEMVRLLIKNGADVNAPDDTQSTPLHQASLLNIHSDYPEAEASTKAKTAWILLENGADVTARDKTHFTPLHLASGTGCSETVRLLIERGADVNALDENHRMPLHLALLARNGGDRYTYKTAAFERWTPNAICQTVQILVEHGADTTARDDTHITPLHLASSTESPELVQLLIKHGADVNAPDGNHKMPLHLALAPEDNSGDSYTRETPEGKLKPKEKIVWVLLEHGADVTAGDDSLSTPLHLASSQGSPEIVRVLMEHGAEVNARDRSDSTPLHLAASSQSPETVKLLIENGADINARDGKQRTPFHLAAYSHLALKGDIVRQLLDHGADIDAKDDRGRTPFQIAASSSHSDIEELRSVVSRSDVSRSNVSQSDIGIERTALSPVSLPN